MGKAKVERTNQLVKDVKQHLLGKVIQDDVEQHNFAKLVRQGIIVNDRRAKTSSRENKYETL